MAFSTSPLNLQGEENKLEKKVCSRGHSILYEVFWQVVSKCNRLQLVNPDKKKVLNWAIKLKSPKNIILNLSVNLTTVQTEFE